MKQIKDKLSSYFSLCFYAYFYEDFYAIVLEKNFSFLSILNFLFSKGNKHAMVYFSRVFLEMKF